MRVLGVVILGFAIVASAWFVVGIRQVQDITGATAVAENASAHTPAQVRHAFRLLDSAATLNPDAEVDILRGRLALGLQQFVRARRILEGVTRSEPDNLEGWIWLTAASLNDRREGRLALRRLRELDPRSAP